MASLRAQSGSYDVTYSYTYDANGNILSVSDGTNTTTYEYDSANQLTRENNQKAGKTHLWTYDNAGNVTSRTYYSYTTGEVSGTGSVGQFSYDDSGWGDLFTEYNGYENTFDGMGNMTYNDPWYFTWEHGSQLKRAYDDSFGEYWDFEYDANGMRTSATNGSTHYAYTYNGDQLTRLVITEEDEVKTLYFTYSADGTPVTDTWNGTTYYYVTNLQGDVVAILNADGTTAASYTYDAWGSILFNVGDVTSSIRMLNPLRYRGYVYDTFTGLYYLQSRYYDPAYLRFLSPDIFVSTGQGIIGNNMFAYCGNNPVNRTDASGEAWWHWAAAVAVVAASAAAVVLTAGGVSAAIAAVTLVANGVAASSTAATVAAGAFIGSSTALAVSAYGAYIDSDSAEDFAAYGEVALFSTATHGGLGGLAAYNMASTQTATQNTAQCFVTGTLIRTVDGTIPIEDICIGDHVWAWDEETGDVALKEVVETYINETAEFIHVFVNGEEIITTPAHPFYSPVKGWTSAVHLRAGDILVLVNGEYVVVEKVQHEILETPVCVFNFQVEGYHTYYVTASGVLTHNMCAKKRDIQQIENAARKAGIPSEFRRDFGDYVEDSKWWLPRDYTYSFNELLKLAEEFKKEWNIR